MRGLVRRITFPRAIAAVLAFNGLLSLVAGVAPLLRVGAYVQLDKVPAYLRLSHGQRLSGLMSVFLGVVLVILARGLYARRRRSWGWAVAVLALMMANDLYRGTTPQTSIPTGTLLIGLIAFRRRFDVRSDRHLLYAQFFAVASVLVALTYGIVGSYLMRAQFSSIKSWTDAIYFTFVTYSTLGYGDMLPQTEYAKLFVISMIIIGLSSFVTALTVVAGPMLEARMKGVLRIMSKFQHLTGHVVVCGYSSVSESILDELKAQATPYVVIDDRPDVAANLRNKGQDVITGDAAKRETLEEANLKHAAAIVAAFDSDAVNTLIAVTAHEYRKAVQGCRFRIIVRVEDEGNIEKVQHIGADEVISPSTMGGRLMAQKALETTGKGDGR